MWNQSINLYRCSSDLQKKSSHDTFQIEQVWTVLIKTPYDVMMSGMKMFSVKSRIQLKDIWYELKFRLAVCSHLCSWCQNVSWYLLQMLFSLYWFYFLHFFGGRYFPLTSQLCQVLNENKLWDYLCSHVLRWRRNLLSWELIPSGCESWCCDAASLRFMSNTRMDPFNQVLPDSRWVQWSDQVDDTMSLICSTRWSN